MLQAALVLEGGALRSLYTSGVLDIFLDHGIEFSCVIAVSAGAMNAANYISKQKGRSARINIIHCNQSGYYGLKQFFLKGNAFNFEYLLHHPINDLYPYDDKALAASKQTFYIAATDCQTGKIVYFRGKDSYEGLVPYLKASSSLPVLSKMIDIDGRLYLDGGLSDPVGIGKAFQEHYKANLY